MASSELGRGSRGHGADVAERHPELSGVAVEALVWDFGYAHW
jgi:hypothetical protein